MMFRHARVRTSSRPIWNAHAIASAPKSTAARWPKNSRTAWKNVCNSEAAAALSRAARGDPVGVVLEVVGQRRELGRRAAAGVRERLGEHPVREPRVARQQRPVEIGADRTPDAAPFEAACAVVSKTRDDTAERLGAVVENRAAGVVLESGERAPGPRALEEDVADHPPLACERLEWEQPDARQLAACPIPVRPPEQLVAAANGENRCAAVDGLAE